MKIKLKRIQSFWYVFVVLFKSLFLSYLYTEIIWTIASLSALGVGMKYGIDKFLIELSNVKRFNVESFVELVCYFLKDQAIFRVSVERRKLWKFLLTLPFPEYS